MSFIGLGLLIEFVWIISFAIALRDNRDLRLEMLQNTYIVACLGGMVVGSIHLTAWLAAGVQGENAWHWYAFALINLPLGLRVRDVRIQNYGIPAS